MIHPQTKTEAEGTSPSVEPSGASLSSRWDLCVMLAAEAPPMNRWAEFLRPRKAGRSLGPRGSSLKTQFGCGRRPRQGILCAIALVLTCAAGARAEEWGTVRGRFVWGGEVRNPKVLISKGDANAKDLAICAADTLYSNDLVVDPKTKGIQNIFVYLRDRPAAVHSGPSADKLPELTQYVKGCRFEPHALFVRAGRRIRIVSRDPIDHHVQGTFFRNEPFNDALPSKGNHIQRLSAGEALPMPIACHMFPHMKAHWLVLDHPYAAVTNTKGEFEIKNLPVGRHRFRVWHERAGLLFRNLEVTVNVDRVTKLEALELPPDEFDE